MTVYEIIEQKEEQIARLTREVAALRAAAQMLEGRQINESELPESELEKRAPRQFP